MSKGKRGGNNKVRKMSRARETPGVRAPGRSEARESSRGRLSWLPRAEDMSFRVGSSCWDLCGIPDPRGQGEDPKCSQRGGAGFRERIQRPGRRRPGGNAQAPSSLEFTHTQGPGLRFSSFTLFLGEPPGGFSTGTGHRRGWGGDGSPSRRRWERWDPPPRQNVLRQRRERPQRGWMDRNQGREGAFS